MSASLLSVGFDDAETALDRVFIDITFYHFTPDEANNPDFYLYWTEHYESSLVPIITPNHASP